MSSQQHSLKPFNTFNLDAFAKNLVVATTPEMLCTAWQESQRLQQPALLIGEGSNVLFLQDFQGTAIVNRIEGIVVKEGAEAWHLHVGAGENWHRLVTYTLENALPGLENMAMIPGCTGSAPIQNIGAYGVELKDVCEYVDVMHLATGKIERLTAQACEFGYRDSIFKHRYQHGYAIVAVGLILNKKWQPILSYGDLNQLAPETVTPRQVFDAVCEMRRSKLPDPAETGNAGSFFKNPVITAEQAKVIAEVWPDAPRYPQADGGVKLAAGWLIDRCDLKGYAVGGAAVHQRQALVLINKDRATSDDIVALAHEVRQRVGEKFNVWLEPEVRFIGAKGEQDAVGVIA